MKKQLQKSLVRSLLPLGFSSLLLVILLCGLSQATEAEPGASFAAMSREGMLDHQTGVSVCQQTENLMLNPGFEQGSGEPGTGGSPDQATGGSAESGAGGSPDDATSGSAGEGTGGSPDDATGGSAGEGAGGIPGQGAGGRA